VQCEHYHQLENPQSQSQQQLPAMSSAGLSSVSTAERTAAAAAAAAVEAAWQIVSAAAGDMWHTTAEDLHNAQLTFQHTMAPTRHKYMQPCIL
jgi:hypothetical protein